MVRLVARQIDNAHVMLFVMLEEVPASVSNNVQLFSDQLMFIAILLM